MQQRNQLAWLDAVLRHELANDELHQTHQHARVLLASLKLVLRARTQPVDNSVNNSGMQPDCPAIIL